MLLVTIRSLMTPFHSLLLGRANRFENVHHKF